MRFRATGVIGLATVLLGCGGSEPSPAPPPVDSGLDARPSNATCLAPARSAASAGVEAPRAFPNLSFASPVALMQAPGDASRWFVVEQGGRVRVFEDTAAVAAAQDFVDLTGRVHFSGEAGLLGLAFHPDFSSNGLAYLNYIESVGGSLRSVTSEFESPDGGLTLNPGSERVLLTVERNSPNHNGGNIAFGLDGFLYIGLGDGGDPGVSAQDPRSLLGKMLRIDVDSRPDGAPYAVPTGPGGNPFAGNPLCNADGRGVQDCPEIYALGLRNPRRWSFDRRTGELWLGDVGQSSFEINVVKRAGNYGWDTREGAHCLDRKSGCPSAGLMDPVAEYGRDLGSSVTGGFVYRGAQVSALAGRYIFGDFGGMVATLRPDGDGGHTVLPLIRRGATPPGAPGPLQISSFGESGAGEIYILDYGRGHVRRLVLTGGADGANVPHDLAETGCVNMSAPGAPPLLSLIPFAPNAVLWSDGATKDRWIALPDGQNISVQADGDWNLPNGTVLVKHFRLGDRLVETRLFMRHPDGEWAGYTYQWNPEATEATRVVGGLTVPVGEQLYTFPSEADCLWCHNGAAGFTLGPETAQLNGSLLYPQTGRSANQITTLNAVNVLSPPVGANPPAYADHTDASESLDARARAYLHINCSICHRPEGPTPAVIDLRHDTPLSATAACDVVPTRGDLGIPDARIIAPGDSARSELLSRMSRRDAFGMPPLASNLPDPGGVALISAWIDSLTATSCQ